MVKIIQLVFITTNLRKMATVWFDASKGKIDRIVIGYEKTKVAIQKDKTMDKIK